MKTESRVIQQALPDREAIELEVAQAVAQTPPMPRIFKKRRFHDRELKGLTLSDCFSSTVISNASRLKAVICGRCALRLHPAAGQRGRRQPDAPVVQRMPV